MKSLSLSLSFSLATGLLSSCGMLNPSQITPNPSQVTVNSALTDVASGLASFNRISQASGKNSGLLVDEIVVDFNVSASADGKLVLDLNNTTSTSTLGLDSTSGSEAKRGNTVKVTMKNIATASLNSVGKKYGENPGPDIVTYGSPITTYSTLPNGDLSCTGHNELGKRACDQLKSFGAVN